MGSCQQVAQCLEPCDTPARQPNHMCKAWLLGRSPCMYALECSWATRASTDGKESLHFSLHRFYGLQWFAAIPLPQQLSALRAADATCPWGRVTLHHLTLILTLVARAQVMRDTLEYLVVTHGSVAAYLEAYGFARGAQALLAAALRPGGAAVGSAANGAPSSGRAAEGAA